MPRRVIGFHLIITAYGFWLPTDPRGSWSDFVRAWELRKFGPATKADTRASVAHVPHDRDARLDAKRALVKRPVEFTGIQAQRVARGFADYVLRNQVTVYACSIMPAHVHMVIGQEARKITQVSRLLKGAATTALVDAGLHPFVNSPFRNGALPTPWTRHEWVCYLWSDEDVRHAVE